MHNDNFNYDQMAVIKNEVSAHDYTLSVGEWIKQTNAIGIETSTGRYGGTYAHKDIAIHFAAWLNPSFYLYLIKEFQRLKAKENDQWMQTLNFFLNRAELHSLEANRFVKDMLNLTEELKTKKRLKN